MRIKMVKQAKPVYGTVAEFRVYSIPAQKYAIEASYIRSHVIRKMSFREARSISKFERGDSR